ncbi:MAG: peptidyl-alpha-hydroxyglycine alpha-amidating lyase family protein [Chloroflexota bacterium]|jgi:DNA-binding beta-propeller fold protein YncE|nr:peptidyl-alpha-hydroxyglycine alpha-amidating lyase family protein [Chloroflexota bacterium]
MLPLVSSDTIFEPVPHWAKIPHGVWLKEATSVAVDKDDNVFVFNRGNKPMLVFDPDGNVIDMWGNDNPSDDVRISRDPYGNAMQFWNTWFNRPHAVTIDHEGNVWVVDDNGQQIHKMSKSGEFLMSIGSGEAAPKQSGKMFNRPTDVAISKKTGEIFITDGYDNSRIHRFDAEGKLMMSWGVIGTDPGEFNVPHNLALIDDEEVAVCDRENYRVQIFSLDGEFKRQWMVHKACAIEVTGTGDDVRIYVAEQGPTRGSPNRGEPNLGNRVGIYDRDGNRILRFGSREIGEEPDQFLWPHSMAIDSHGDVYVAEVSFVEIGKDENPPREMASLRKWRRAKG